MHCWQPQRCYLCQAKLCWVAEVRVHGFNAVSSCDDVMLFVLLGWVVDEGVSWLVCGLGGFVRSAILNEMTHGRTHTYWCTHTRTGVRWVTAHSTHTHAHKYIKHAACSSLRMQTALARRTQSIKNTTTEYRMNQRHHGEHAVAEWRTKNQRKEKKEKKKGEEGPLFPFYGPIREGKGFWVTPCRKGGRGGGARHLRAGEGWANQNTPTCQSQSDGVKKKGKRKGDLKKKSGWQGGGGRGAF